jgi:pimeloyl-ACP methyl ester carboxylesterase
LDLTWSPTTGARHDGHFVVDDVSPRSAATQIDVPVLLIHGARDRDTPPMHSQRVFAALHAPKRLIMVNGASHNDVLNAAVLAQIADWLNPLFEN